MRIQTLKIPTVISLFLVLVIFAVYWKVINHEFINYDDNIYIIENRYVKDGLTTEGIIWAFTTTYASNWHPLTWLSHMTDIQLFGLNAGRHHITSLLFHTVNTLLLFIVLKRMTGALWQSAFVSALFALHPMHVESVAWAAERKDVLSAFFWLLTMWTYAHYIKNPGLPRYLLVLLIFMLGLMAKPMLVTLPFVLLLLDYWPLGRFKFGQPGPGCCQQNQSPCQPCTTRVQDKQQNINTEINFIKATRQVAGNKSHWDPANPDYQKLSVLHLLSEKIPFFVLIIISSVITFIAQNQGEAVQSLEIFPLNIRVTNAIVSYVSYIGKMVWPQNLAVFYPHFGMFPIWKVIGASMLLVYATIKTIMTARNNPYVLVGWMWFLGTLVPVIGLVQIGWQSMADRYTYVPCIGFFIIIAWGLPDFLSGYRYKKAILVGSGGVVLLIFMILTSLQLQHWHNSTSLFKHALDVTVDNYLAHNSLGTVLAKEGKADEAITHFSEALRIKPNYAEAQYNIGLALAMQGKFEKAANHFSKAVLIRPEFANAHHDLGNALSALGNFEKAIIGFSKALLIQPNFAKAHHNLGLALVRLGKVEKAAAHVSKALKINPNFAEAHYLMGLIRDQQNEIDEAIIHFNRALKIRPDFSEVYNNLKSISSRKGKNKETFNESGPQ